MGAFGLPQTAVTVGAVLYDRHIIPNLSLSVKILSHPIADHLSSSRNVASQYVPHPISLHSVAYETFGAKTLVPLIFRTDCVIVT